MTASKKSSEPSSEEQSGVKRKKLVRVKRRSISDKNEISKTATTPELTEDMPADKSTDNLPANKNKKKGWLRKIFE